MVALTPGFYERMHQRLGERSFLKRIAVQVEHASSMYGPGLGRPHLENIDFLARMVDWSLRAVFMRERGRRNTLAYAVINRRWQLPDMPAAFDGLRILHLTDLHLDGLADDGSALVRVLNGLSFDLCLLTGDYRFLTHGSCEDVDTMLPRIAPALHCSLGVHAVLGNHDFIEQVAAMEENGISVLLNESVALEVESEALYLVGVDDPHFYGSHDLHRAFAGVPQGSFSLLLAHSPELYADAAAMGGNLYFCGHTHGGQICLPGGVPVITHSTAPRRFCSGAWNHEDMRGYTSRGVGCSAVAARFNCPPEITLHTLKR